MVTVTVVRLVDPLSSHTSLQDLASHQAAPATPHVGVSAAPTMIGTIHGPGVPGHIAVVGGSVKPVVNASNSHEGDSNIFMVLENDDEIIEVGTAQGPPRSCSQRRKKWTHPTPQEAKEWVVEHPEAGLQEEVVKDLLSSILSQWMI